MHIISIAPPHLDTNEQASLAMRVNTEAHNALNEYLTGGTDFSVTVEQDINGLRANSQRENILLACTERPGELRAQDDETDLGFRGFAPVSFPLQSETHAVFAHFNYVDDFAPEVFETLLDGLKAAMADRNRTTLHVFMNITPIGLDDDPRCDLLRRAGFELGLVEQASELDLALAADPEVPAGLTPIYFEGYIPPEEHIDSFLDIMEISEADVPATDQPEPRTWTREMLEEAQEHHARLDTTAANALLVDGEGIVAFSYANLDPSIPEVVEQALTVVHRRARGKGLGMLIKQVLYRELKDRYPALKRVTTYNALNNERMLAVNEKLGLQPKFHQTTWKLALS